jgi:hypothetical protein
MIRIPLRACGLCCLLVLGACGGGSGGSAAGPASVAVPNVVGLTQAAAAMAITGAGLAVGAVTTQSSAMLASGDVISESPAAGASVASGTAVSLVVSTGPAPAVTVPNVVGLAQAAAMTSITGAGLAVGAVTMQSSTTVVAGAVISENPAAGASVAPGSTVTLVVSSGAAAANALAVVIDAGPASLVSSNQTAANTLFASVTLCTPGSTSACQTIDHVQVDTGSVGLRILSQVLTGAAAPATLHDPATGLPLLECVQFVDGYTWGSVVVADVVIGGRTVKNLHVNLIGDAAAGAAPTGTSGCVSGPAENTVAQFGANGVLGVGNWLQDCGAYCASVPAPAQNYYVCPNGQCQPTTVALNNQLQNPVAMFASDNNGIVVTLPSVAAPGAVTVNGTLYFGVATQANNAPGAATFFTLDGSGNLITTFAGSSLNASFIDSGSNAYFFNSSITVCTSKTAQGFDCPASATAETATIRGLNGAALSVNFTVDNADTLFALGNYAAFPTLAGPNAAPNGQSSSFDWGLPFFFGRSVYVLFEGSSVNSTSGPAIAF